VGVNSEYVDLTSAAGDRTPLSFVALVKATPRLVLGRACSGDVIALPARLLMARPQSAESILIAYGYLFWKI
jgi:hypothetical protein